MSAIFGTDGVRGVANLDLTPELALRVARAGAAVLAADSGPSKPVVVGRDTRVSGTMLEAAVVAGITSAGRDALCVGIVPTPGVARITALIDAAAGVMISASHNPVEDNGIKFFRSDGFKLTDEEEGAIETALATAQRTPPPTHAGVGIARTAYGLVDRYFATLVESAPDLGALTIVVDAAFGAAYEVAPRAFARLGAQVETLHAQPDGTRINVDCGSTNLAPLAARVRSLARERPGAHVVGVAFDGDADRALFVDETGASIDGDRVMLALASDKQRHGTLPGDTVVGTVMSNIGLERALARRNIALVRAAVGDRYVLEAMRAGGYTFGGEQSGHIIDLERNTTGDGPATAVALFSVLARERTTLHDLVADLHVAPQILLSVRTMDRGVIDDAGVRTAIERAERELGSTGRILVRRSGTEPLVRVMIEGDDRDAIERLATDIADTLRRAAQ